MEVEAGAEQTSAETTEVADATEAQAAQAPSLSPQIDIEARAFRMGWRPKDQYRGPDDKWISADQYIEVATESMPVLRKTLKTMEDKYDKTERRLAEMADAFNVYREFATKAEVRSYEKARSELVAERDAAIAQADVSAVKAVDARIAEHETTKPTEPKRVDPGADDRPLGPDIKEWIEANPWFNDDPDMRADATDIDNGLRIREPTLSIKDRLAKVKIKVQRLYPEKFANTRREAPSAVGSSNGVAPRKRNEKSYENLPPEAKKACDKFVLQMKGLKKPFTRDEYVAGYEWPE
jgi:hypothetical protein